uniref:Uncharacterized protein n=1 Tax=Aotus nancymaae TaxID=37293 RepID=A0A2K5DMV3_AOTNA
MEIGWMHNRRQRQVLVFFVLLNKHKNWAYHKVALQAKEMEEQN